MDIFVYSYLLIGLVLALLMTTKFKVVDALRSWDNVTANESTLVLTMLCFAGFLGLWPVFTYSYLRRQRERNSKPRSGS